MRVLAFLLLCVPSIFSAAQSSTVLVSPAATVTVPAHPIPPGSIDLGPARANLPASRVLLFLGRTSAQQAELDALVSEQSDPASPEYHRFLTPQQFGRQFGPSDQGLQSVTQWLTSSGYTIERVLDGRLAIEFTATTPQLEAAFGTRIHVFARSADSRSNTGNTFYANATPPHIPATLAPYIKAVSLSNIAPQPLDRPVGTFLLHPPSTGVPPQTTRADSLATPDFNITGYQPCAPTGVCYALVPGDVASIYDTKPLLAAGIDGTGVTIGIPSTSNIDLPTVQRFRTLFLPKYSATNLPHVILDGQDPGLETIGSDEAYIDVETAGGVAPKATINLYTAAIPTTPMA